MRRFSFLVMLLLASLSLFGCSSDETAAMEATVSKAPQASHSAYEVIGKIVGFGPGTVEILHKGKLMTYALTSMEAPDTYLGEIVGVSLIENDLMLDDAVYELTPIIRPDSETRRSAMGETIHEISGIVETVNKNNFSLQTETGLIWMETYDNQNLVPGTQMKIDYMNWGDHMMMVYCYHESLRFLLTVTEKSRSEAGNLILSGTKEDGTSQSLVLTTGTVLNFSHASLRVGDTVMVYPMNDDADSKSSIIPNRVDRIQFRSHRTTTKPILH